MADEEAEESDYAEIDSCEREVEQEHRKCDQAEAEAEASGESDLYVSAEEIMRMKRKQQRQKELDGKWNDSAMHEIWQQVGLKRNEHVAPSPRSHVLNCWRHLFPLEKYMLPDACPQAVVAF